MDSPEADSIATSKQNDLLLMSKERAVDRVLTNEWSTRTVTSGSARHVRQRQAERADPLDHVRRHFDGCVQAVGGLRLHSAK